ncbi:glycosyltransferase family protein [Naumannella halotolerans]|uniref:Putative glycosyltransferase n=1 Tax=Naumannella halotolerans TaxID=993414 RepID=A0A4R7JBJ9_9ACTN|nr:glycosyltransferase [Naumannella halotolerans]TDT34356.1 putative glycosyltransferase [Naumannella halotolerans]
MIDESGTSGRPHRVMLYSHDSVGLGHTRRNRELAHALARSLPELTQRSVTGLLVSGLETPSAGLPSGFDAVRLPAIRKSKHAYKPRHLQMTLESVVDLRSAVLHATVRQLLPDLMIIDRHPFGIGGELLPSLRRLREEHPQARIVLGLRDVLDSPGVVRAESQELTRHGGVDELIDAVWVYGDPMVHDLSAELPDCLAEKVFHTGYLAHGRRCSDDEAEQPYVLTTVGGGADGLAVCAAAARAEVPAGHRHLIVTGPQMPEADQEQVRRAAGLQTSVLSDVPDVHALVRRAAAVISMVGYNTACEILNTQVPALLVPREKPRLEQKIRADAFARHGLADTVGIEQVSGTVIGDWLRTAIGRKVDREVIGLSGLAAVPGLAAAQLAQGRTRGAGLAV